MSLNRSLIQGNLTKDPELRYTPSGTPVCNLSIANNRRYTLENGAKREETTFVDCVAWNHLAESIERNFQRGKPILIEGRLAMEKWTDKSTQQNRSRMYILVEGWHFCGGDPTPPRD